MTPVTTPDARPEGRALVYEVGTARFASYPLHDRDRAVSRVSAWRSGRGVVHLGYTRSETTGRRMACGTGGSFEPAGTFGPSEVCGRCRRLVGAVRVTWYRRERE